MWTVESLPERLDHAPDDPWGNYSRARQILTVSMMKQLGIASA
jgi:hypothetical protein